MYEKNIFLVCLLFANVSNANIITGNFDILRVDDPTSFWGFATFEGNDNNGDGLLTFNELTSFRYDDPVGPLAGLNELIDFGDYSISTGTWVNNAIGRDGFSENAWATWVLNSDKGGLAPDRYFIKESLDIDSYLPLPPSVISVGYDLFFSGEYAGTGTFEGFNTNQDNLLTFDEFTSFMFVGVDGFSDLNITLDDLFDIGDYDILRNIWFSNADNETSGPNAWFVWNYGEFSIRNCGATCFVRTFRTPDPASFALFAFSLLGISFIRKRKAL